MYKSTSCWKWEHICESDIKSETVRDWLGNESLMKKATSPTEGTSSFSFFLCPPHPRKGFGFCRGRKERERTERNNLSGLKLVGKGGERTRRESYIALHPITTNKKEGRKSFHVALLPSDLLSCWILHFLLLSYLLLVLGSIAKFAFLCSGQIYIYIRLGVVNIS